MPGMEIAVSLLQRGAWVSGTPHVHSKGGLPLPAITVQLQLDFASCVKVERRWDIFAWWEVLLLIKAEDIQDQHILSGQSDEFEFARYTVMWSPAQSS